MKLEDVRIYVIDMDAVVDPIILPDLNQQFHLE